MEQQKYQKKVPKRRIYKYTDAAGTVEEQHNYMFEAVIAHFKILPPDVKEAFKVLTIDQEKPTVFALRTLVANP